MSRFCVVEGTKITLNDTESIPIEKIKVGQEILTFDLNTLQKSQKYDTLVKMKTNKFGGIFQEDLVKNVWKNTVDEYYLINDKLKITKDHIVMAKRDQTYYWTKVENLLLNDYLFTELNIFERIESIIIVKEKVKVFNLEVNRVFNYFANSYLIHNGAPCSACLACGNEFYFFGDSKPVFSDYNSINYKGGVLDTSYVGGGSDGDVPVISIFDVPPGFDKVHFEIYGADGGLNDPNQTTSSANQHDHGRGTYIRGHFRIRDSSSDTDDVYLQIGVGETWDILSTNTSSYTTYNGGGAGSNRDTHVDYYDGYNGGGATHIAFSTSSGSLGGFLQALGSSYKSNIIIVAGGGGGSAWTNAQTSSDQQGGNGYSSSYTDISGGVVGRIYHGTDGIDGSNHPNRQGGTGGSSTAGLVQESGWESDDSGTNFNGDFGEGGWRNTSSHDRKRSPPAGSTTSSWQGGGGGGGWYGGGSGSGAGGGGGGGSSFVKGSIFDNNDKPVKITGDLSNPKTTGRQVVIEDTSIRGGSIANSTPKNTYTPNSGNMNNSDRRGSGFVKLVLSNY